MARRIAIFLTAVLVIIGMAFSGALLWATSDAGAKFMSAELKSTIRANSDLDVAFAKVEFDLFPPRLRVQDIAVKDLKGKLACTLEEAELAPSIIDLLTKTLTIEEAYLGSPRCTVHLDTQDLDALFFDKKGTTSSMELNLSALPEFEVFAVSEANLSLTVADPGRLGTIRGEVTGFGLDVTSDSEGVEVRGLLQRMKGQYENQGKRAAETILGLKFRAAVTEDAMDVRHLSGQLAEGTIRLRDAHIPLPIWPTGPEVAELAVVMPLDVINRLPLDAPHLEGAVRYSGQLGARRDPQKNISITGKGRLILENIRLDDFVIGDLDGELVLTPQGVAFDKTTLKAAQGEIGLSGSIAFDEPLSTEINAHLHGVELGRLLEQVTFDGAYVTQKMTGPVHMTGQLKPLHLSGNVKINVKDHVTWTGPFRDKNLTSAIRVADGTVTGGVTVTDKIFDAPSLRVKAGNSHVRVHLAFNFPEASWMLDAQSDDLHLEDVGEILGFRVGGRGPVSCLIAGPLADPRIKGRGDFRMARLEDMDFDRAATEVHFRNLKLAFKGIEAERGASSVRSEELLFDFNAKGGLAIRTRIDAERVLAEELMDLFHIKAEEWGSPTGDLSGSVDIDYNLKPEHLHVRADITHDKLQIVGENFGQDVLKLDWDDGLLTVHELGLRKGRGTISVTGTVDENQRINFTGVMSGVETGAVDFKPIRDLGIDAVGQAFAVIEGTVDHPKGRIELSLGRARRNGARYGPSKLTLSVDGFRLRGRGRLAGEKISVEHMQMDLKRRWFQAETYVQDMDLIPILGLDLYGRDAEIRVTGEMSVGGRLAASPNFSGHAELMKIHARVNELKLENRKPMKITMKRSELAIGTTRFYGPDVAFDFGGTIGLDTLNIKANGIGDLSSVSSMVDGIRKTKGELTFQVRASGALDSPSFRGTADLKDGMVRLSSFPHDIDNIGGHITFSPKIIKLSDFRGTSADGTLEMEGELAIADGSVEGYTFRLNGKDLELAPFDDLSFKVSTVKNGLTLTSGKRGALPNVTGDAEIRDLRYTQDLRVLELTDLNVDRLSGKRTTPKSPKILDPEQDFFTFDVRLHGDRNMEAHNNLFDVDLAIDDVVKPLRFVGTNQSYGFLGRILAKQGQVRFAGRRFELRYGYLDFQDKDRPSNPNFQVIADGQIRDWKVTLTAEGNIDEYEIGFASQPYLHKEDIAFLILTGMTKAENRQFGRKGFNLGMPLIGQLGPGGGDLPVELQVYNEYSESAGTDTTRVAMGRWISEDIWVSVSSGLGQTRDVEAQVDYEMSDELSVSAGYEDIDEGSVGNVGVDLKFRLEF